MTSRRLLPRYILLISLLTIATGENQRTWAILPLPEDAIRKSANLPTALLKTENAPPPALGIQINETPGTILIMGPTQDKNAVVSAVSDFLSAHPSLIGNLTMDNFNFSYAAIIPATNRRPAMAFVQFIQKKEGLEVKGSYIHCAVKLLPDTSTLMSIKAQVYSNLNLPTLSSAAKITPTQQAVTVLNISTDAVPMREQRFIRYIDGQWRRVYEARFEANELTAVVDMDTGDAWVRDDRYHVQRIVPDDGGGGGGARIQGRVEGQGISFYPLMPVSTLYLKDLQITAADGVAYTNWRGDFELPVTIPNVVTASLQGKWADVDSMGNANLSFQGQASPATPLNISLNSSNAEFDIAQINGYYHTTFIHDWIKNRLPTLTAIDSPLSVTVNNDETCNAHYDDALRLISFDKSNGRCVNTAFDTVIYHEYGHFADDMAGGIMDEGLSEGWGDVLAVYATGQPFIGEGFYGFGPPPYGSYIRRADNNYQYPANGLDGPHELGKALSGFAWHLRENLINSLGPREGIAVAENLMLSSLLANSPNIPGAVFDALLLDDNDADISNGTPHAMEILDAAGRHSISVFNFLAEITAPENNVTVDPQDNSSVNIAGTASGIPGIIGFEQYELFYGQGSNPSTWIPIGQPVLGPVANGTLGIWDVSVLTQDIYTLKLVLTLTGGLQFTDFVQVVIEPGTRQITSGLENEYKPEIRGNRLVWISEDDGNQYNIHLFDFATNGTDTIAQVSSIGVAPDLAASDSSIVWAARRDSDYWDFYRYGEAQPFTESLSFDIYGSPLVAVAGEKVVWGGLDDGFPRIYLYDLTTRTRQLLTNNSFYQWDPDISGNFVVCEDARSVNGVLNADIYLYDLGDSNPATSLRRITFDPAQQKNPAISGNYIVWEDYRQGTRNPDIYLYDLTTNTERPIATADGKQINPAISGHLIVWEDRTVNSDIHLYDLTTNTERRITVHPAMQTNPSISGNRITWQDSRNGGNWDVYSYDYSSPVSVKSNDLPVGKMAPGQVESLE